MKFAILFSTLTAARAFTVPHNINVQRHITGTTLFASAFDSLTVPELKEELKSRGLKVGGKKAELIDRLYEYEAESTQDVAESVHEIEDVQESELEANVVVPNDDASFQDLGLIPQLVEAVEAQQWDEPTPIQRLSIPQILDKFRIDAGENACKSLWAEAPTGSGKTGAFSLPMIQLTLENRRIERNMSSKSRFSEEGNGFQRNLGRGRRRTNSDDVSSNKGFVTTLILAPTRELALQISGVIEELVEAMPSSGKEKDNIDVCVVTGGVPMEPQIEMLAERKLNNRNVDILVATPGRLADVLTRSTKEDSVDRELEKKLLQALDMASIGKNDVSLSLTQLEDLDINKSIEDKDDGGRSAIKDMLSNVRYLVIDEADRLLSQGFKAEMDEVLQLLPKANSQTNTDALKTLLFSATFPEQIQPRVEKVLQRLSGKDSPPPLRLSCAAEGQTESTSTLSNRQLKRKNQTTQPQAILEGPASTIDLRAIRLNEADRTQALRRLIEKGGETYSDRMLVFVGTRYASEHVAKKLRRYNIKASELHGKLDQDARMRRLEDFKKGKIKVLLATDLASRGLDVQGLPCVVNYDLPRSTADFVHRIGRTGRAGQSGEAVTFITANNEAQYDLIEKRHLGGKQVEREILPGFEPNEEKWEITKAASTVNVEGVKHSSAGLAHDKMFGGIKGRRKSKKDRKRETAAREAAAKNKR
ncbi:ATP-dependent RNA helicase [Chaetoceros tenuissimus]|uniref:ATP-dependent RNA helicase n=1 Tax=Chaetoceros tenuissimus TaxID=426638 RepID=A0AAD3GZI7_9STRA|nr:ATP-dependent RNA helicase [Chaetoceros tenuissimus]